MSEHTISPWIKHHGREIEVVVTFAYTPGQAGDKPDNDYSSPLVDLVKAVAISPTKLTDVQVTELARNWLADEGYDLACDLAEEQRGGE